MSRTASPKRPRHTPADPAAYTLAARDIAVRLRLGKVDTVLAWIHSGDLPAIDVSAGAGRPTWRISEQDLTDFLERRRARPPAKAPRRVRQKPAAGVTRYSAAM